MRVSASSASFSRTRLPNSAAIEMTRHLATALSACGKASTDARRVEEKMAAHGRASTFSATYSRSLASERLTIDLTPKESVLTALLAATATSPTGSSCMLMDSNSRRSSADGF